MATILTKKKDSSGVPATADLTNSTGGAELAINTADKRLYTKNSSNVIVEVGTTPTTLDISGAVSAGSTFGITGNTSAKGTFSVIGAVSVGSTLGVTGNASVTGTLAVNENLSVAGEFTFATANSTGNVGILKNASVGGTLLSTGGVSDADGSLRDVPQSRTVADSANLATTDLGGFVLAASAGVKMTIPASTFDSGDILSVIARGASAQISAGIGGMIIAGNASATSLATIADNGVVSLIFTSAAGCFVTGNVS